MKPASRFQNRARRLRRPRGYRPLVESLEERLPPGDAVLGGLLARSLVGPGFSWVDDLSLPREGQRIAVAGRDMAGRGWAESTDLRIEVAARGSSLEHPTVSESTAVVERSTAAQPESQAVVGTSWESDSFDILAAFFDTSATKPTPHLTGTDGETVSSHPASLDAEIASAGHESDTRSQAVFTGRTESGATTAGIGEPASQPNAAGLAALTAAAAAATSQNTAAGQAAKPGPIAAAEEAPASILPSPRATSAGGGPVVWSSKRDGGATDPRDAGGQDYLETFTVPTENATGVSSHTVLQQGVTYTLVAAGDAKVGSSAAIRGDAGYQDFAHPRSYSVDGSTPVGLKISGVTVVSSWGPYHPHHIYQARITGTGQAVHLSYSDQASAYALHLGSLSVQLFRSGISQAGPLILGLTQFGPVPPTDDCSDDCNEELPAEAMGAQGNNSPVDAFSDNPVRWSDGTIRSRQSDLQQSRKMRDIAAGYRRMALLCQGQSANTDCHKQLDAMQKGLQLTLSGKLNQTRSYTNSIAYNPNVYNGPGMVSLQLPYIQDVNGDGTLLVVVSSGTTQRAFENHSGSYTPRAYVLDTLVHTGSEFVFTDTTGQQFHFADFSAVTAQQGQLNSVVDQAGNTMTVTRFASGNDAGKVSEQQWVTSAGGATTSFVYTYLQSPDPNQGLLSNVTLRRKPSTTGTWTTVEQVAYTYYTSTGPDAGSGNAGNLQTATTLDATGTVTFDKAYLPLLQDGRRTGLHQRPEVLVRLPVVCPAGIVRRRPDHDDPQRRSDPPLCRSLLRIR
jgi:hypothetical protein